MRLADIQAGEEYRVGYSTRCRVLETRVERTTWRGTERRDGVRVLLLSQDGSSGDERVFSSAEIKQPWQSHCQEQEAARLERDLRRQASQAAALEAQQVRGLLQARGVEVQRLSVSQSWSGDHHADATLVLSADALAALKRCLQQLAPEALASSGPQAPGSALEELLS